MTSERAIALLRHMVDIPSVSGDEGALAAYLAEQMAHLGFRSRVDPVGNAIGEIGPAAGPLIMLLGHLDTVPGLVPVRREGTRLYGRGAVDAKGPLATFVCAAASLGEIAARVVVVGAVEEEVYSSRGARFLLDRHDPAAVIIGEPSGWSGVVMGYKGRIAVTYAVSRPPSHTAGPAENAAEAGVAFWTRIVERFASGGTDRSLFYRAAATLTRLEASTEHARVGVSCRIPPGFDVPAFSEFLSEIRADGVVRVDDMTPPVLVDRGEPTVRALVGAIRRHGGRPVLKLKTGTSDMNVVADHWRAPMAAYGPGDSVLDHTVDEHIDLDEYVKAIEVLADALPSLAADLTRLSAERERVRSG